MTVAENVSYPLLMRRVARSEIPAACKKRSRSSR